MSSAYLLTSEVADRLGRTVRQVHYLVEAGRLEPAMKGNGVRGPMLFDAAKVEALANELTAEAAS